MTNFTLTSRNWLTKITSQWLPRLDYLSPKQATKEVEETNERIIKCLERLDKAVEANTQVLLKLTQYLEDKGL
ncbi:hypothetical protein [Nostoc sp. FACHB-110]|uniref:hypothetical protein n=1 Tax=Nostoc sp. FACHB-110 TaxID=2692834 RepID=UPI0016885E8B|nr:hypothetical protein [Nostoc sp. FACHB-110]MBD2435446.1 hypothetical protein [Nostoc sp. FACHB-110]